MKILQLVSSLGFIVLLCVVLLVSCGDDDNSNDDDDSGDDGVVYIGSADHKFYAINADGTMKWEFISEEIIDSSALLDDAG